MFLLARLKAATLVWVSASLFFAAVLEISELGRKPIGFALYSNTVHFALWALPLPLFAKCIRRFPLKDPKQIRNIGSCLILVALLALRSGGRLQLNRLGGWNWRSSLRFWRLRSRRRCRPTDHPRG
jgi:hypothetical protein